jgi:protein-disulfide isomerase
LRRFLLGFALVLILAGPEPARAGIASFEEAIAERVLGRADAPVTILEHSSLACPHCATFHRDTLPRLTKEYIDTGKVRLVFVDFPLGGPALAASMIARCAPKDTYFGMIEVLFRDQERWSRGKDPLKELERIARLGGLSEKDVQACLDNQALLTAIRQRAATASEQFGINSTPTFLIEGAKIEGAMAFEDFQKVIENALRKKKK